MTRPVPAEITDVLVERGDRDVVRRTAGNAAAISAGGYSELIKRARQDGVLTLEIGQRDDLSGDHSRSFWAERSTSSAAVCGAWSSLRAIWRSDAR